MLKSFLLSLCLLPLLISISGAESAGPLVLFDEGHGQAFLVGGERPLDLSLLGALFRGQGSQVRRHAGALTDADLVDVSALVVSGPFAAFSAEEIAVITRYVESGGALAVMLHIGPPLSGLLHALGVDFSNGVIREHDDFIAGEPLNFNVRQLQTHPLFAGLDYFALYGGWALMNIDERSNIIASTGPTAWVDLNNDKRTSAGDAMQAFGVAVAGSAGAGRFVVFADDAIFQNRFLNGNNQILATNLGRWLTAH